MAAQYDSIAAQYRLSKESPLRRYVESWSFFNLIGAVEGRSVLDLGCGEGFYTRALRCRGAARIVGVDVSPAMIDLAQRQECEHPLGIEYLCSDVRHMREGKTFTSINLAISMAKEQDFTVLLVDCDDVRRSTSKLLQVDNSIGLVDILEDPELDLSDAILSTSLPKLRVLPAGTNQEHSPELLAGERMQSLISEMSERYMDRIIIFDSPPLLATSQAIVLAQFMGQIIVVVEAGKTPLQAVQDSIAQLDRDKAIGMVLNKSPSVFKSDYYGEYYGHYE